MTQFEYVAVLVSIIVGLALAQLLRGLGQMVVNRDGPRPYWVHLIWTAYFFINIVMFWWWEFRLVEAKWSLTLYLVLIIYATLFFFVSIVIQPGKLDGASSYKEYYYSRRRWIFGLLIALVLWDFVDTYSKGFATIQGFETEYLLMQSSILIAACVAIVSTKERYHEIFSVVLVTVYLFFMFRINYAIV